MAEDTAALVALDAEFISEPHAMYRRLLEKGPAHRVLTASGATAWLVIGYDAVRAALSDSRLAKDVRRGSVLLGKPANAEPVRFDPNLVEHMLNADPPDHGRLRRLVPKVFTPKRMHRLRPRVRQISAELLDGLAGRTEIDLLAEYAYPLPIRVIGDLLGVPPDDVERYRTWSNTLVSAKPGPVIEDASTEMAAFLRELLAAKRSRPADDLLSTLVHEADAADRLTEPELISVAFLLLLAGHETTVTLIGNGMLALLDNPDQLAALRDDAALLPGAIEEFLRYDGPVGQTSMRFTTEPIELDGVTIPAGQLVLLALASANRDPARFSDPDRLDLARNTTGHLAFGHGIHFCIGAPLARLEAEVAFTHLLHRYQRIQLAVPRENLRRRLSTLIHGLVELPLRVG